MKIIILVVMLFTNDGDGKVADKVRHEFVQDSMAACAEVQRKTMSDYYQRGGLSTKTGIMIWCRTKEVSSDGQAATEGRKFTL